MLLGLSIATAAYWLVFLSLPVSQGLADSDGQAITRGGMLLSSLLYPEGIVASWFDGGRLPARIADRSPLILATLLWLGLAALVGLPSLVGVGCPNSRAAQLERLALATLAGLGLLSSLVLVVGLAGGLHSSLPLASACGGVAAAAGLFARWLSLRRASDPPRAVQSTSEHADSYSFVPEQSDFRQLAAAHDGGLFQRGLELITMGLVVALTSVMMLGAWVPSAEFDVLEYHLQAPKEFFERGAIEFLPHNIYANMPLGAEMHSLAMMTLVQEPDAWFTGLMGKSILASISLLGAMLLGAFVAQRLGSVAGWSAAGMWLGNTGIAQGAMLGLVDGVVATYVVAAAIAVTHAAEATRDMHGQSVSLIDRVRRRDAIQWWWLAGLLSGSAAAAKYPGLLFAVVPVWVGWLLVYVVPWVWTVRGPARAAGAAIDDPIAGLQQHQRRQEQRVELIRAAGVIVLGLSVTCGLWYAKNWALAGNPVYPLAGNIFGGKTLTPEKIAQWQQAHRVPPSAGPGAGVSERLIGSARAALSDAVRLTLTSPFVQPAMICGLVAATVTLLLRRGRQKFPWMAWLVWSLWIAGVWWSATHRIDRFWLPLVGLWSAVAAMGLQALSVGASSWLTHAIVILGLGYSVILNSTPLVSDNRFFVSIAALRDDRGDERQVARITAEQAWVNQHLAGSDARVLLIGEARVFEYHVPILYSTCFDTNPGEPFLRNRAAADQLAALHERGITHILVNWEEIARYRSPGNYGFSDWPQPSDIQSLIDNQVASRVVWSLPDASSILLKVN